MHEYILQKGKKYYSFPFLPLSHWCSGTLIHIVFSNLHVTASGGGFFSSLHSAADRFGPSTNGKQNSLIFSKCPLLTYTERENEKVSSGE